MKKVLLTFTLCTGMLACSGGKTQNVTDYPQTKKDAVEVLYFHGAQRCTTCMAIEKSTKELIESSYAEHLKNGKLAFRLVDITQDAVLADKHEVSWSSLILVDYSKNGKESAKNLTEFAFSNVRNAPDKFKAGLSEQITVMLNN